MTYRSLSALRRGDRFGRARDAGRFDAFVAFFVFIFNRLAVAQGFEAFAVDYRVMNEHVFRRVVHRNEPEALLIVEPLNFTCGHRRNQPFRKTCSRGDTPEADR